jgi:peptide/nickel transport system substrate-binding protein
MARTWQRQAAVFITLAAVLLTACQTATPASPSAAATGTAAPLGKLTVMVPDFGSERMDGALAGSLDGGQNYSRLIHAFLISHNAKRELVPGIASAWTQSADALTWTFTIRSGVKFHDGSDLTAADVAWSLQHAIGPEAIAWNSATNQLANVSRNAVKIEVVGTEKVAFTSKNPEPGLTNIISEASTLWVPIMPKRATLHDTAEEAAYDKNPIGAGPMKLVAHQNGVSMTFERFNDYYYQPKNGFSEDRRTPFQTLQMVAAPEEATRVAALRAGQADIVTASVAAQSQVEAGGGRLVFAKESLSVLGQFQTCWDAKYPCSDKRVRQALSYAIDKSLIQSKLAGGPQAFEIKGWGQVTPSTMGYSTALDPLPFDPNKARQLMTDAGYPGGKGFGKFTIWAYVDPAVPFEIESAQTAADSWKRELGLDVEVKTGDTVALDAMQKAGQFNGQIIWKPLNPRVDAQIGVSNYFGDLQNKNLIHRNQELITATQQAIAILDPVKKLDALTKLYARLADEGYFLDIGHLNTAWGIGPRLSAWQPYNLTSFPSALYTLKFK